ncbi:hypothetical protein SIAM614_18804 [Roseibium aggregatum IAM 12614]|uniref:Uncharacterized protein n=1 Tax=Roseibium aggregatum (strain ATCC 25650 / DSM 13394 / JCM 20685 / NBRC 16684 / NCIMB 2208 / IAM 12614 / B1) TaxID=384765 RepID=A0NPP1_ROSAI|nr:hypothetical protein SIAM614_18804 [Roseibium aggregatum IAM 12614]
MRRRRRVRKETFTEHLEGARWNKYGAVGTLPLNLILRRTDRFVSKDGRQTRRIWPILQDSANAFPQDEAVVREAAVRPEKP